MQSRKGVPAWAAVALVACLVALAWWLGTRHGADSGSGTVAGTQASVSVTSGRGIPSTSATPDSGLGTINASELPKAARSILVLIHSGGPFRYSEDGQTFGNREGLLPKKQRGYYKEYTVKLSSGGDRGPYRIIGGQAGDLYWTADHYASFQQIVEGS